MKTIAKLAIFLILAGLLVMFYQFAYNAGANSVLYDSQIHIEPGNAVITYKGNEYVHSITIHNN